MTSGIAYFDCRAFQCSREDVQGVFRWRQLDAFRNGVGNIARSILTNRELHKVNVLNQIKLIREKQLNIINTFPSYATHGTWIKKKLVEFTVVDKQTNVEKTVTRPRIIYTDYATSDTTLFNTTPTPSIEWLEMMYVV